MLEQTTVQIGKDKFVIQQMPATRGLETACAIGKVLKGAGDGFSEETVLTFTETRYNVAKVVGGIIDAYDVKHTPELIRQIIKDSMIRPEYDEEWYERRFSGNYDDLYQLLAAIIKHNNYEDVLKKRLLPLISALLLPLATDSTV